MHMGDTIPQELIDFADEFSKKYKILDEGTYKSKNDSIELRYVNQIKSIFGEIYKTPARVNSVTGVIEISKQQVFRQGVTENTVFYWILWCYVISRINKDSDYIKADVETIIIYKKTGRPLRDIPIGYGLMIKDNPEVLTSLKKRLLKIKSFIKGN